MSLKDLQLRGNLLFFIAIITIPVFFITQDFVARIVWEEYQNAAIASVLNRGDAELAVEIGNYYFNTHGSGVYDLEKAKEYFDKAIEIDPLVPEAWHQSARIDFLNGDLNEALFKIDRQIEIFGEEHMASYYIRGLIYGYQKEFEKAEENFLVFLDWSPGNWATNNDLAWIYFQKGEYQKAADFAGRGLEHAPNNPWLLNLKGIALLNLGEKDTARGLFEQALAEAKLLTSADWELAYPGNDPRIAGQGLTEMVEAIEFNLNLVVD